MNQIKETTTKSRQIESKRNREIMQLKKEQRAKDNQIKTLESDKRQKEIVLKRKQEEVCKTYSLNNTLSFVPMHQ